MHPSSWMVSATTHVNSLIGLLGFLARKYQPKTQDQIQNQPQDPPCTGTALKSAVEGLHGTGGRIFLFSAGPGIVGQGAVKDREAAALYGTENEQNLYIPAEADKFYSDLARECAENYISVDLFMFGSRYSDIASIGQVPFATGESMNHYSSFNASLTSHRNRLTGEIGRVLSRSVALESVMKVRCSTGVSVHEYAGEGIKRVKGGEVDIACWDADTAVAVLLEHDGSEIKPGDKVYLQAALLYTSTDGQRRVRVHNTMLTATDNIGTVFKYADCKTVVNILARYGAVMISGEQLVTMRSNTNKRLTQILHSYRTNCAAQSSPGQLILLEALKLAPLYILAALRSDTLRVNNRVRANISEADVRVDATPMLSIDL